MQRTSGEIILLYSWGSDKLLQHDDASLQGCGHRLRPILDIEFVQDMADVQLDGYLRDVKFRRNLLVAVAFDDHTEHLNFAPGQGAMREALGQRGSRGRIH